MIYFAEVLDEEMGRSDRRKAPWGVDVIVVYHGGVGVRMGVLRKIAVPMLWMRSWRPGGDGARLASQGMGGEVF